MVDLFESFQVEINRAEWRSCRYAQIQLTFEDSSAGNAGGSVDGGLALRFLDVLLIAGDLGAQLFHCPFSSSAILFTQLTSSTPLELSDCRMATILSSFAAPSSRTAKPFRCSP
ncbi:MAG TPA: hypothetical protein VEV37_00280 [Bryobacteraceae bacterium]|nr:hypothetical protein [Bryobacteraceae bacterium]